MKKIFTLAFTCLCAVSIYAQEHEIPDGTYVLEQAELFIRHHETKEIVEHKVFKDTAKVLQNDWYLEQLFLEVEFADGQPTTVTLPDRVKYAFDETMHLSPASKKEDKSDRESAYSEERAKYEGISLQPYDVKFENNRLIITHAPYNFGQSGIDFTMQAELIGTMRKLKEDEKDNQN